MKLIQVKQFNREAHRRYRKAVEASRFWSGGFPFLPMYLFLTEEGEERQRGWVATEEDCHCFGINKEKAIARFNKYR